MMIRLNSTKLALLIGMIYSRISLEQMKTAIDEVFKDGEDKNLEYSILNPLFGYMFRANGCVENMRFYSSELDIKYNDTGERIYSADESNNSLTNLLIQLFPSHTGTFNNLVRKDSNFTNWHFKLEKPCDKKVKANNREANIKMLGDTFVELLKNGTNSNLLEPSKNSSPYRKFKYYITMPSSAHHLKDDEIIIKLLTLYAYVLEELDSENELKICLKRISDGLGKDPTIKYPALLLSDKQKLLFKHLYVNPFKFPYSKINPPVSNSSIPVYDRKEDKPVESKTFSDCADIVILHLCNCLFYDELTGECSLVHLNKLKDTPTEPNRLKQFYEKYHHKPFKVTEEMRNAWSRVVKGLDDNKPFECQRKYKPYMIHYRKEGYRNEIRSGLLNTMSVLANICGLYDEYKEIMTKGTISEDSVDEKLAKFFKKICDKNFKITIIETGIEEIAHGNMSDFIGDFYITFNLKHSKASVTMKLHISKRHTDFFFEGMKSEVEKADLTALENLSSDNDSFLLSLLINRYIKLLNNNDAKTENFDYFFEIFYNQGALHTNDQKRNQCIHLCEFISNNNTFDHRITKKVIANIVKSAALSDPATKLIFRPFFVYIDDIFKHMSNYEVTEIWLSLFSRNSTIKLQSIRNAWNEAVKRNSMKIGGMGFSSQYANSIDDVGTIISATKDTLEDLRLKYLTSDPHGFTHMIQEFLDKNTALKTLAIPQN